MVSVHRHIHCLMHADCTLDARSGHASRTLVHAWARTVIFMHARGTLAHAYGTLMHAYGTLVHARHACTLMHAFYILPHSGCARI